MRGGEAKDTGMAGAARIITPDKVRELQIALYRKAKAKPKLWILSRVKPTKLHLKTKPKMV